MTDKKATEKEEDRVEFIPLSEAKNMTGYTPEYLNLLSRTGKLKAKKIGRNWYTKKSWVEAFLAKPSDSQKEKTAEIEALISTEAESFPKEGSLLTREKKTFEVQEAVSRATREVQEKLKEMNFIRPNENRFRTFAATIAAIIIIVPLMFAAASFAKSLSKKHSLIQNNLAVMAEYDSLIINENLDMPQVAGEETEKKETTGIVLASENYRVSDINIGGDILTVASAENKELEISNIKSESFVDSKKNESKLIITWQTNKMAISQLDFSKNNGQENETLEESSYGFLHSAIIPGLEQGASYVYQIKCKDRWANEKISDYFGVYTSAKPVSVFDLISNAMGEVFGWAIKK